MATTDAFKTAVLNNIRAYRVVLLESGEMIKASYLIKLAFIVVIPVLLALSLITYGSVVTVILASNALTIALLMDLFVGWIDRWEGWVNRR